jgi:hypothetical protein
MRVLLDNCTPRGVDSGLGDHEVTQCRSLGWDRLKNGHLLDAAEQAGFEILITSDQSVRRQQNLTRRSIAIIELGTNDWRLISLHLDRIKAAVEAAMPRCMTILPIVYE